MTWSPQGYMTFWALWLLVFCGFLAFLFRERL